MRRKTGRRLRFVIVFMVACIVALVTGSAMALATSEGEGHGGGTTTTTVHTPDPCTLKIVKALQNAPGGTKYSSFGVQVEYPDGSKQTKSFGNSSKSASFEVTVAGDYKIIEVSLPANFTPTYSAQTVTFSADDIAKGDVTKTATITNSYARPPDPCKLKVEKKLDHDVPSGTECDDFSVQVEYPDGTKQTKTFSHSGGTAYFEVTAQGDYKITEVSIPEGFSPSYSTQTVNFSAEDIAKGDVTKTATITNTYASPPDPCKLKIEKKLDHDVPSGTEYEDFSVQVEYPDGTKLTKTFSHSGNAYFEVTAQGDYKIIEVSLPANFSPSYSTQTVTFSPEDIAEGDETKTATITNTYAPPPPGTGSITVAKVIDQPAGGTWKPEDFSVTLQGPGYSSTKAFGAGGSVTFAGLPLGDYVVSEVSPGSAWAVTMNPSDGGVKVTAGSSTQVTVTNRLKLGAISVHKTISGPQDPADTKGPESFSVTVTGPNGYSSTKSFGTDGNAGFSGLAPGQYVVTENDPGSAWQVTSDPSDGVVNVVGDSTASVQVTNALKLGTLRVNKTVSGPQYAADAKGPADFSVTVKGPNGAGTVVGQGSFGTNGYVEFSGLVPGEYVVTEDDPGSAWRVTTDPGDGTVMVVAGSTVAVNVTNQLKLGSLRVTKTITGALPTNRTWKFEDFSVVVTGPAPESTVVFNGSFDSKGEILVPGLLPGTYTVTEEAPGTPWVASGNGTIEVVADGESQKEIVNTGTTSTTLGGATTQTTARRTGTTGIGTGTTTATTLRTTATTVLGFTGTTAGSTPSTVMGWVAQPGSIQTGGGGTAGGIWGPCVALVLAGLMSVGVIALSVVGVRRGTL
jgi:hypothetical protein